MTKRAFRASTALAGLLAAGMMLPGAAKAQTTQDDGGNVRSSAVEEVVVTARRREEAIHSVPIAVQAFSQQTLMDRNINSFSDLQYQVLSMTLQGTHRDEPRVSIRGQGGYSPGAAPGVGVYFNEVPLAGGVNGTDYTAGGGPGRYYDLNMVEVLKGPQGTLFGRNSTGGAVLLTTKRPTQKFEGYLVATAGNYGDREIQGALNIPIADNIFAIRIAGNLQHRDGFTHSLGQPNHLNGVDLDDRNTQDYRVSIEFKPVATLRNDLVLESTDSHTNGTSAILSLVKPGTVTTRYPSITASLAQQTALGIRTQIRTGVDSFQRSHVLSVQDIAEISLNETIKLRNILGYMQSTTSRAYDGSGSLEPIIFAPYQMPLADRSKQLTEEIQFQGRSFDDKLTWTTGGFYLDSPAQPPNLILNTTLGSTSQVESRTAESSKALYAAATFDLGAVIPDLKIDGGFRYTWDKRFSQSKRTNATTGACTGGRGADANCLLVGDASFSAPTWNAGLTYQPEPDMTLYASVRKGYRTGGFNLAAIDASHRAFNPEYVTDFELGAKTSWNFETMSGFSSLAIYHDLYDDIQLTQSVLDGGVPTQAVSNAAKAEINGVEFETAVTVVEGLDLGIRANWFEFRFLEFITPAEELAIRTGFRRINEPKFKYGLTARYSLPVSSSLGRLDVSADWSWQAASFITTTVDPLDTQPAYGLLGLAANWRDVFGRPIDVAVFVTNATGQTYVVGGFPISNLVGTSALTYGEPRMFGTRLSYHFRE